MSSHRVRRNVVLDVPDWPGWENFMKFYKVCDDSDYPDDSRLYFVALFETGCRESESILLRPDQFRWNEECIVVNNVVVLKKKVRSSRDVFIVLEDNPLAYALIDFVEDCDTRFLFPSRAPFSREKRQDRATSHMTVYRRITEIHPDLFPHGLRAYRASHLVHERGFSVQDLMAWFTWTSATTAIHYTRTRDIAKRMGITELP